MDALGFILAIASSKNDKVPLNLFIYSLSLTCSYGILGFKTKNYFLIVH